MRLTKFYISKYSALNTKTILLLLIIFFSKISNSQESFLQLGDQAPDLRVGKWIKGVPVTEFQKGKIYVLEFWATWCLPCKAAMPHLSLLSKQYQGQVIIVGINIKENNKTSREEIEEFVNAMGNKIEYTIAIEDKKHTQHDWIDASGSEDYGIPITFVIDKDGKLAWIGNPFKLPDVLHKMVNNTWDMSKEIARKNLIRKLRGLDKQLRNKILDYTGDLPINLSKSKADSLLVLINAEIQKEPKLEYMPATVFYKFSSLLIVNNMEAYKYGKRVLETIVFDEPEYDQLIYAIEMYKDTLEIPNEIFLLGGEAYSIKINRFPYPEIVNLPKNYSQMAEMYWLGKENKLAIIAQAKAIEEVKKRTKYSSSELESYQKKFKLYATAY